MLNTSAIVIGLMVIIIFSLIAVLHQQVQLHFLALFYLVVLTPVIIRTILTVSLRKASSIEYELDGIGFRTYTGSKINAFYCHRDRNIYVHEELLKVLTSEELKVVLQHEQRHREQAVRKRLFRLYMLTSFTIFFWLLGGLGLSIMGGYLSYMFLLNVVMGRFSSEVLELLPLIASLHLIFSTVSLILTCAI